MATKNSRILRVSSDFYELVINIQNDTGLKATDVTKVMAKKLKKNNSALIEI